LKLLAILFCLLQITFSAFAQNETQVMQDSLAQYNKMLSTNEMQEDLKLLRDIRKEVNSGLYIYHSPEQIDSIYNWAFSMTEKPLSTIDFYKIMLHLADYEGSVHKDRK